MSFKNTNMHKLRMSFLNNDLSTILPKDPDATTDTHPESFHSTPIVEAKTVTDFICRLPATFSFQKAKNRWVVCSGYFSNCSTEALG